MNTAINESRFPLESDEPSRQKRNYSFPLLLLAVFFLPGALITYILDSQPQATLTQIKKSSVLTVLTRNAPTTYFEGQDGLDGFEYRLTQAFAAHLGLNEVRYLVYDNTDAITRALLRGDGQLAAAGITRLPSREQIGLFGPTYMAVREQLVCHRDVRPRPVPLKRLPDLRLRVASGTSYIGTLIKLRRQLPELGWEISGDQSTEQILADVAAGNLDCTIADSNIIRINQRYYPELVIAHDLTPSQALGWMIPADAHGLRSVLAKWFRTIQDNGELQRILDASYGHLPSFDYVDIRAFKRRIKSRLPRYQPLFIDAAEKHQLPWTLIAAQAYQESHWNRLARSPTGVRGIMMLTRTTARSLGVKNRLDARQSIPAGSAYLKSLLDRIPDSVEEEDRILFALAAYNIGLGHIRDARLLARQLGFKADTWRNLSKVLPLLTQRRYYRQLRHGYARGPEAITYVQHIQNYRSILDQHLLTLRAREERNRASLGASQA